MLIAIPRFNLFKNNNYARQCKFFGWFVGSTQEGEVREESESDYDFTDISDGEVEKEVEELLAAAAAEWWH